MMNIPTDYIPGYEAARTMDADLASRYVAHTTIGDPDADALMDVLAVFDGREAERMVRGWANHESETIRGLPSAVRDALARLETVPDWLDHGAFGPGSRMALRNSRLVVAGLLGGVLIEGFSTNISKSFVITGRLRDQGVRRLQQNNRHLAEIFLPGGLARDGDGWKTSVRLRLVHARVRRLLKDAPDWDAAAWGEPLSAAHMGFAITAFSARLLKHMERLGAEFNDEERRGFMAVWRYTGYLMGIPESILFRDESDARALYEIGLACEPPPADESVIMANALVRSAPLVLGTTDPDARRALARYVFKVSRSLIGPDAARQLKYPPGSYLGSLGALWQFRFQERYRRVKQNTFGRFLPPPIATGEISQFAALIDVSLYDQNGIDYRLPDHVYSEQSSKW